MTFFQKIRNIAPLSGLVFVLIVFFYTTLIYLDSNSFVVDDGLFRVLKNYKSWQSASVVFGMVISFALVALAEEFAFRFWLIKTKNLWLRFLSLWSFYLVILLPTSYIFLKQFITTEVWIIPIALVLAGLHFGYERVSKNIGSPLNFLFALGGFEHTYLIPANNLVTILSSGFVFGFIHANTFSSQVSLVSFLVSGLIFASFGFFLSFIRIKYGFWLAVLIHIAHNITAFGVNFGIYYFKNYTGAINYWQELGISASGVLIYLVFGKFDKRNFADFYQEFINLIKKSWIIITVTSALILIFASGFYFPIKDKVTFIQNYGGEFNRLEAYYQKSTIAMVDGGIDKSHIVFAESQIIEECLVQKCENLEHGTTVAGVIAEMMPKIKIYNFNIYDGKKAEIANINKALAKILELKDIEAVNISLNTNDLFDSSCDSFNLEFDELAKKLSIKKIPIFVSTGNNGSKTQIAWPSCHSLVFATTGVNSNLVSNSVGQVDDISNFSSNFKIYKQSSSWLYLPSYDKVDKQKLEFTNGTSIANPQTLANYLLDKNKESFDIKTWNSDIANP